MKFLHITDTHLTVDDEVLFGTRPGERLAQCLAHAARHHHDAERCVITGDLTHWGEEGAYRELRRRLEGFPVAVRLLLGNHDKREPFRAVFPQVAMDAHGFVQSAEATSAGRFIYLDSTQPLTHAGHYCELRQQWLRAQLEATSEPCYLFMHHHPASIGVYAFDLIGQTDSAALLAILRQYRDRIRHIFFGHCHLPLSGTIAGVPFASLRGTNHQSWQDFTGHPKLKAAKLAPAYNVVLIEHGNCIVHTIEYDYDGPIAEFGTAFEDWSRAAMAPLEASNATIQTSRSEVI